MEDMLARAAQLAQGSDPASALPLVEALLQSDPGDANALTLRGLVAQRTGDPDAAVDAFAAAHAADPLNPARMVNLGLAQKGARRFAEAVAMLKDAAGMRPDHTGTLANLGSCLIAADRAAEAVPLLERAHAGAPGDAGAANNLGVALARTGRHAQAIETYRRALDIRPGWPEARLNLADALRALGRADEAAANANAVLQAMPGHPRAANLAGLLKEEAGERDEAIAIWRGALDHGFSHPVGVNLLRALVAANRADEVAPLANRMLDAAPQSTTPLAYLAAALDRMGERERLDALCGHDRFVRVIDVGVPAGFADRDEFHARLHAELRAHPSLMFEPEGLVTRKGRQSGDLVHDESPALAAATGLAETALREFWTDLGAADATAGREETRFLDARPDRWSVTMWGTILQPGGAVEPHIHAPNWLSGVYYPGFAQNSDDPDEGAFAIGMLPESLGGGGTRRIVRPGSGRMILFPSFLWHATLPFGGDAERISLAFDLVPETVGRPHRLRPG